ncbi:MAG TPA: hypothetical protein DCM28_01630 [Phycisphaerales bacterium]|nr:hypothetical protein [Phycisphaerales bacterium]|tara:strand:- start:35009 stop:37666 length:2658 start_codon:yes stop_codon:yes gene_type:complete
MQPEHATWLLMAAIFCPLICGTLSLLIPRPYILPRLLLILCGPIGALLMLSHFTFHSGVGGATAYVEWMPLLHLDIALKPDHLGLFFAYLVSGIGVCIVLYARGYFGKDADSLFRFYPYLMIFMTALIGVALSDNYMLLMMFWEMTSISSFLLIGWDRDIPQSVRNAMQAFIVTGAGGLCMLAGLIFLGVHTGEWTMTGMYHAVENGHVAMNSTPIVVCFILVFLGAATKSAQFPFQFWLPGAMAAPTPVSAYLHSATMVKAGVFITGRFWPILAEHVHMWPTVIIPIGAFTMVYGAYVAIQKTDLKKIFAYTTVSQLGLLMTMYGLAAYKYDGQPNLIWDVTQILNHALYKAPLFILAGAIGHVATRELPDLKGFFYRDKQARIMTIFLLLAGYGLAAGPFTLSFSAKEMFFYQIYHALHETHNPMFWLLVCAGIATGMFNVAIFIRLFTTLMAKPEAKPEEHHHDDHAHGHGHDEHEHETGFYAALLWLPGAFIVSFQYICGIIPYAYDTLFAWLDPSKDFYDGFHGHFPMTWNAHLGLPLYMSLIAIGLGIALGFGKFLRGTFNDPCDHLYPGFYTLTTKYVGPGAFGIVQRGHAGFYVGAVLVAMVGLFLWSIGGDFSQLVWPETAVTESFTQLLPGLLLTFMVCLTAILLPIVMNRASRVLLLGMCGFSVAGVYYLYKAPDLALTQLSIEIVSLILFLLVLSLVPDLTPKTRKAVPARLVIGIAVGLTMFWMTLSSTGVDQPTMPYLNAQGQNLPNLGEYFLRNSHHGVDTMAVPESQTYGGIVTQAIDPNEVHANDLDDAVIHADKEGQKSVLVHHGGGGNNVVNVILVDFRGFDTMGEITVLGLAAMGVWTLLRRRKKSGEYNDPSDFEDSGPEPLKS